MVKGDAESSLIISLAKVMDEKMPPKGEPQLTVEEQDLLVRWINEEP